MLKVERQFEQGINHAPPGLEREKGLPAGFYEFLLPLHREFTPRQQALRRQRQDVLRASHQDARPAYRPVPAEAQGDWRIELPLFVADQRNQMTGPADDAELCVKMINSGAPGVMLDLEDSMANHWSNLERGIHNALRALHGELTYYDHKRDRKVPIISSNTVIFTRARGLHLNQAGVIPQELMSASLYDVARIAYGIDLKQLSHPLCFYIPKSESAAEALWWRDVFQALESKLGWGRGSIKCMALVEAHPLAYQLDEFIYNLREHLVGLNLGRWDYMASLIHFNLHDPAWVLPDRNTIPHDVPFFQRLRELLVETCHKRGILAIGGMTALFPSRTDAALNEQALKVLEIDKRNEAQVGMDGAWTGHPDQNRIAVAQFPVPNQDFIRPQTPVSQPDLRPSIAGVGQRTLAGTRAAVRTVIRYRHGVLCGKGASLLDGYMEDLATDRIYRLMIAQRMRHYEQSPIVDEQGRPVSHTPDFITQLFDEELSAICDALPPHLPDSARAAFTEARRISEAMILNEQHDPS
jgi:malate synthase